MFKFLEPNRIFSITSRAPKYVLVLFVIVLTIGLIESLILSPEDYKQGHSVRIMYVHVPAAWITLGIFSTITLLSIFVFLKSSFYFLSGRIMARVLPFFNSFPSFVLVFPDIACANSELASYIM